MVIHRSEHIDLRLEPHQGKKNREKKQAGPQSKLAEAESLIVGRKTQGGNSFLNRSSMNEMSGFFILS